MANPFDQFDKVQEGGNPFDQFDKAAPKQGNAGGSTRAAIYGFSGGQVPFAQSITSGIGAGIAKAASPFTGDERTMAELYNQAMEDTRATQAANPKATMVGNIGGIASTLPAGAVKAISGAVPTQGARGLVNAIPNALSKVGDFVRGGAVAQKGLGQALLRGAKAGAIAAPVGFAYGAGEAEAQGDRIQSGLRSAGMAAGIGAALPVVGSGVAASASGIGNIAKGIGARGEGAIADSLEVIKEGSRSLYKFADESGVLAKPEAAEELLSGLSGIVKNKDIASQRLYSSTLGALNDLSEDIASGNTGLMTLDRHRQILGNIAKDITNPNKAQEAEAASRAIDVIDGFIEKLTPEKLQSGTPEAVDALLKARKEWSKGKKFEKIGNIIVNASGDANKLKRDLERFRTNKKNTLGWNEDELNALKEASTQTTGEGMLKLFGKFGFDLGSGRSVGNTALPVLGSVGAGLGTAGLSTAAVAPAATVAAIGTAARSGQKAIAAGKAENLLKVIEQGGKITKKMIDDLPTKEKNKFLKNVMLMQPAKANEVLNAGEKVK